MRKLIAAGLLASVMVLASCQNPGQPGKPAQSGATSAVVAMPELPRHVSGRQLLRFSGTVEHLTLHTAPVLAGKSQFQFACLRSHQMLNASISGGGRQQLRLTGLQCIGLVDHITITTGAFPKGFTVEISIPQSARFSVLVTQL
jgi:hypothetical protein